MSTHSRQDFDENEEMDKILQDLIISGKISLGMTIKSKTKAEEEASEQKLIDETEEWNEVLRDLNIARESQQRHLEDQLAQISLLERQRQIVLDEFTRLEKDKKSAEEEDDLKHIEENGRRTMQTIMMLQTTYALDHRNAFFNQFEETDNLRSLQHIEDRLPNSEHERNEGLGEGCAPAEYEKEEEIDEAVNEIDSTGFGSEDGGALSTVVTKCDTPDCQKCEVERANTRLESPDSSTHFDGGAIFPVITECHDTDCKEHAAARSNTEK
ncbi:hypothetical protein BGZ57DRAFT_309316 [Hyaloscypha finlandica]|nr:hypothetical protein BGZ57DRAFT_309316 [Hyaloscypha finlandica]